MYSNAQFEKLTKVSGTSKLVQGVKRGRTPAGAVAGGNGSFIVGERAKLFLTVVCENGAYITKDIYFDVKNHTARNITNKFCDELEVVLKDFNFLIDKGSIVNLDKALEVLN